MTAATPKPQKISWIRRLFNWACYGIFWSWNTGSLALIYLGFLPLVGFSFLFAIGREEFNLNLFLTILLLMLVPVGCSLWGLIRYLNKPGQLMHLFFGLEAPLILLCLIRLFVFRQMPLSSLFIVVTFLLALLAYGVDLAWPTRAWGRWGSWLQLTGHSLLILTGLYGGILLSLYVPPTAMILAKGVIDWVVGFFRFEWVSSLQYTPWETLPFFLLIYSSMLLILGAGGLIFILLPFVMTSLYLRSGWRKMKQLATTWGSTRVFVGSATVLSIWLGLFLSLQTQPQVRAFALLENPPASDQARQELLQQSDLIRSGLLNAYLSPYRYLSTRAETQNLREIYREVFGWPRPIGEKIQAVHNTLFSPFLYDGSLEEQTKAAQLYEQFFDEPIQKGQSQLIRHALEASINRDDVQAGLLDIDQKRVWLAKQEVNVQSQGDIAQVEIHELYENNTWEQQEVFYAFSLPESAVVTGLWLGETEDLAQRYLHVVAPRGAAQQVYTQEVRRQVDPALLEQVGPQQYRLRAFPVPPRTHDPRQSGRWIPGQMHLWMTYQVLAQPGGWPLPHLLEQRNIYWTRQTERWQNGEKVSSLTERWFPTYVRATAQPQSHQITLPSDPPTTLTAQPFPEQRIPKNRHFALILDTSYSMWQQRGSLRETFLWLDALFLPQNQVDVYVSSAEGMSPRFLGEMGHLEAQTLTLYGSLTIQDMLHQFHSLRNSRPYDALVLVTDTGSYERSQGDPLPVLEAPLWILHLGDLPAAYDDPVLEAITETDGGVDTNLQTLMTRLETQLSAGSTVLDGYRWQVQAEVEEAGGDPFFAPLAARYWIRHLSRQNPDRTLADLDRIHTLAKEQDIVTPFSSMLVLVNDEQRQALAEAEAAEDRFEREVETGTEVLTQPFSPFTVTGVPEPEEWLLIGIALALGSGILYRQRRRARA
ncbi:TIGR02921 family PEP-CTERM protein [Synechococcus sp. Nb3U1]|uniref:TIGR02921 family PEP-CTERM protein n=1 Tax=Synechococcus sp. Nb3U1 TaxID=1914529 RepID=UPI001F370F9E|nr:TIGR02921 family PEP-CTERM protein [Synechococcus sp. Nb3U1]MCF2971796.1 TIGR02921 family PEP-CTERM protein [Synechococcus sp. Nb3U1]